MPVMLSYLLLFNEAATSNLQLLFLGMLAVFSITLAAHGSNCPLPIRKTLVQFLQCLAVRSETVSLRCLSKEYLPATQGCASTCSSYSVQTKPLTIDCSLRRKRCLMYAVDLRDLAT